MKAAVFEKYGLPEVLEIKETPKPEPKEDEILVKVFASTVVLGDHEMRGFTFPAWFWLPLRLYAGAFRPKRVQILGQEFSGVIEAVGKDVKGFKTGEEVFGPSDTGFGTHVEYKCFNVKKALTKKPKNISHAEAACLSVGGLNSLHYLRLANIQKGEKVLINGAAGNIGSFGVQIAKYFGAEVTAVDTEEKFGMLRQIGADHVIDYRYEDFTENGKTYDVIFDVIGKAPYRASVKLLKKGGRYLIANPKVYHMVRSVWTSKTSDKKVIFRFAPYHQEELEFLAGLARKGKIKPYIGKSFPLEQIIEAHKYVMSPERAGNVVITL